MFEIGPRDHESSVLSKAFVLRTEYRIHRANKLTSRLVFPNVRYSSIGYYVIVRGTLVFPYTYTSRDVMSSPTYVVVCTRIVGLLAQWYEGHSNL